jgi:hypothetical protein
MQQANAVDPQDESAGHVVTTLTLNAEAEISSRNDG